MAQKHTSPGKDADSKRFCDCSRSSSVMLSVRINRFVLAGVVVGRGDGRYRAYRCSVRKRAKDWVSVPRA